MVTNPRASCLLKAAKISEAELGAAIDAYVANPRAARFRFRSGYELDVTAAVEADPPAKVAVVDPDRSAKFKRTMIRMAILLALSAQG